jgi:hypothetical protein
LVNKSKCILTVKISPLIFLIQNVPCNGAYSLKILCPELHYINGPKAIVADALSSLYLITHSPSQDIAAIAEYYGTEDVTFPLTYPHIQKEQLSDASFQKTARPSPYHHLHSFVGVKPINLLCYQSIILVPEIMQKLLVLWYHKQICHASETRTEQTIQQHFCSLKLREMVKST